MTLIKNYNFSTTQITAVTEDTANGNYLWLGFEKNNDNVCILQKVSASNPLQVYYEIEMSVDEITALYVFGSYLYVAVDDGTYFAYRYSLTSPLTSSTSVTIPSGVIEVSKNILDDGTYLYFLLPGEISGEVVEILQFSSSLALNQTITLTGINNAKSFTIDTNDNIWVVTYESPSKLIRVYDDGGFTFDTTTLL